MSIKTFNRYEIKFVLDEGRRRDFLERLMPFVCFDRYCQDGNVYSIYNIYYDTDSNGVIRKSLNKPYYKEKLRLRTYERRTDPDAPVFLELKKKIGGIVNKRRASLALGEAERFLNGGLIPERLGYVDRQVLSEIGCFLEKNNVRPKVFLAYDRLALYGNDDKALRITFDTNLRSRRESPCFESGFHAAPFIDSGVSIVEVKHSSAIPLWLAGILSELHIYKTSFSKYGTEYILQERKESGGESAEAAAALI